MTKVLSSMRCDRTRPPARDQIAAAHCEKHARPHVSPHSNGWLSGLGLTLNRTSIKTKTHCCEQPPRHEFFIVISTENDIPSNVTFHKGALPIVQRVHLLLASAVTALPGHLEWVVNSFSCMAKPGPDSIIVLQTGARGLAHGSEVIAQPSRFHCSLITATDKK